MRDDAGRLLDILEAVEKIQQRAKAGREAYLEEELLQVWMVHHLQIIGEAAGGLSQDLRHRHAGVPWPDIIAMRNVLVHQYFGIDLEQVWDTVVTDLPRLKRDIASILAQLQEDEYYVEHYWRLSWPEPHHHHPRAPVLTQLGPRTAPSPQVNDDPGVGAGVGQLAWEARP